MEEIGVGPHERPWPEGDVYDEELLKLGDKRNVINAYRYWTVEAIKQDLAKNANDFEIAIENWQHDFNIGTIVRNANAFNARRVHIIGKRHWNKRGAMVTDAYLDVVHHASVADFVEFVEDKRIIAIDNTTGSKNLSETVLPSNAVFVFGGEGPGLSVEMIAASEQMVKIEQFGSTRSVNVGVASGIVMYQWIREHKQID
jgi:tRNA G18 (ribose-2'-O)-methylase SpoU